MFMFLTFELGNCETLANALALSRYNCLLEAMLQGCGLLACTSGL